MTIKEEVFEALKELTKQLKRPVTSKEVGKFLGVSDDMVWEGTSRLLKDGSIRRSVRGRAWILQR
jgi:predicted transcriptional regulator of viral defense system